MLMKNRCCKMGGLMESIVSWREGNKPKESREHMALNRSSLLIRDTVNGRRRRKPPLSLPEGRAW